MMEMVDPIYCRKGKAVREVLKGKIYPIENRPSNHRPGVQAARVSLGHRGSLLTVQYVSEVEQVRRGLAEQSARGRGLRTWGPLFQGW